MSPEIPKAQKAVIMTLCDDKITDIVDTDEHIQEAVTMATTMPAEITITDIDHDADIEHFAAQGCGCKLHNGQPCSSQFTCS